ncbi:MAG: tetratricopeptide repeat protein [Gemmatimonadota bacterium]|nr:tetratricopeptide repeat protein [Gemmatimonadota bacterium]MDP7032589.1 tetratricopeptide repeat protein [Gemmatimonadota bacterium]
MTDPSARAAGQLVGWRRWAFPMVAVLGVPLAAFLLLEGALRLAGYGTPTDFLLEATHESGPVLTENSAFGRRFFPARLARTPARIVLPLEKAPGTVRVFVVGGSAAMGDPDASFGIPRILQAMLEDALPGRRVEVVNAAMTAINSHVVRLIARDCLDRDADALVVYLGNNEVVGPFGAGSAFGIPGAGPRVARTVIALRGTRTGQLLYAGLDRISRALRGPEAWQGMESVMGQTLPEDHPALESVYAGMQDNLAEILHAAKRSGVPVVLSTVAVNLGACPPFASHEPPGWSPEERARWKRAVEAGVRREEAGDPAGALDAFTEAQEMAPGHAETHYRRGMCLESLGRFEEAGLAYGRARDTDALRFRADRRINAIIRELGAAGPAEGVFFADAEKAVAESSPGGIPAADSFLDHVHFTFPGNWLVARELAVATLAGLAPERAPRAVPSLARCAERLGWSDGARHAALEGMTRRFERPPFTGQLNADERRASVEAARDSLSARLLPHYLRKTVDTLRAQLAEHADDTVLRALLADHLGRVGDPTGSVRQWREVTRRVPHSSEAFYSYGLALSRQGNPAGALGAFEQAVDRMPRNSLAHFAMAEELASVGRLGEAVDSYRRAVETGPDHAQGHKQLGDALLELGRPEEAVASLREAVRLRPSLVAAWKRLGDSLDESGHSGEAMDSYRKALSINPDFFSAHRRLGDALLRGGDFDGAAASYREALRIQPGNEKARAGLEKALAGRG